MIKPALTSGYVPLWCKSNYSFLEGASHPEELIEEAARLGIRSLALTDRDGVYGIVRAYVKTKEFPVHLIIGSEVTIEDNSTLTLLATNATGYANLCELVSDGQLRTPKGESQVKWSEVCERSEGLIALWGGDRSLIAGQSDPLFTAKLLKEAFPGRDPNRRGQRSALSHTRTPRSPGCAHVHPSWCNARDGRKTNKAQCGARVKNTVCFSHAF
jgi:hypothetical protein